MSRFERACIAATVAALGSLATLAARPAPLLVWNVSPSAPLGLYAVDPFAAPRRGDRVIARLGEPMRALAARRHYLPANVPLVKGAAASAGDRVCASGKRITVNRRLAAVRLARDHLGRPLPAWSGCVTLKPAELFLLNPVRDSFDGRYFGVTTPDLIIGKAILLWRG